MERPRVRAIQGGFEYIMRRPRKATWALVESRARGYNNGYLITVARPRSRKLNRRAYVIVTIRGNQAPSLSAELRKPPLNALPIDPWSTQLLGITKRVEWICGYWDQPPDLLVI